MRVIARRLVVGHSLSVICDELVRDESDRDVMMTLHVLGMCARTGGDIAITIDSLVITIEEREHARAERRAHAATALASIRLITWLPIVCGGYIVVDDANVRHTLVATPLGWVCIGVGASLNFVGRQWTNRLVERS